MDREYFAKFAANPDFIPGIYNYCDRWCERCQFSSRCVNFALEKEHFGDIQDRDGLNEAFWEKLSEMLHFTLSMVKEMAEEKGVDLDSLVSEDDEIQKNPFDEEAVVHIVTHTAKAYANQVDEWFDFAVYYFDEKEDPPDAGSSFKLVQPEESQKFDDITEMVEVIRWYQHQIYVKLRRAVTGELRAEEMDLDDFPKDSDGSAKVVLIGIDRSVSAWGEMLKHFPDQEEHILKLIVRLHRLRKHVENVFPNARAFIRPGFDDM